MKIAGEDVRRIIMDIFSLEAQLTDVNWGIFDPFLLGGNAAGSDAISDSMIIVLGSQSF